jgi:hypothetical protein
MDREEREAQEALLCDELSKAWAAYLSAAPEEKDAAKGTYMALLEAFTKRVLRARGADVS